MRRLIVAYAMSLAAVGFFVAACSTDKSASTQDGPSPVDTSGCPTFTAEDLPPGATAVTGTISAGGLDAVLCPGGASARIETAGSRQDTTPYVFYLDYTVSLAGDGPDFVFRSPAGANHGELAFLIGIYTIGPATYSTEPPLCGSGAFTYYLPIPPNVSCDGGTDLTCPIGCGRTCPGSCKGIPCEPEAPSVSYTADATADCIGNKTPAKGSWTLTLTSVDSVEAGISSGSMRYFTPHGTFTASMPRDADGGDVASLTVSF